MPGAEIFPFQRFRLEQLFIAFKKFTSGMQGECLFHVRDLIDCTGTNHYATT
jgi:hypothetical protein